MSDIFCTFASKKLTTEVMAQAQPTLQSILNMVQMLPYDEQKQLLVKVSNDLSLHDTERMIDANWKSKPTYSVDEGFEQVYKHLGGLYGLNDIREAK